MSEDVAYSVEDGGTPPPEPAPAPEPVAEAPAPAAEAPPVHEPDVEVDGQRMVPLAALSAAREELRTAKEKAARFDEFSGWYTQNKPYVDFLQAHPDLITQRQQPAPQAAPAPVPEDDPELVNLARTLDLYTPDGKPDAKRAAALATFVDKRSGSQAQEAIKPLHEMSVKERANVNLRDALAATLPNGMKPNPDVIRQIWQNGDPKMLATQEGAALAVLLAGGLSVASQPAPAAAAPAAPGQPPVHSEPAGRTATSRAPVTEFEQRVMGIRGISNAKYAEYTSKWKPGASNALED